MADIHKNIILLMLFIYTVSASIYLQESNGIYDSTEFSLNEKDDVKEAFKKALQSRMKRRAFQNDVSSTPLQPPSVAHPGQNSDVVAQTVLKNDISNRGKIAYLGDTGQVSQVNIGSILLDHYYVNF